MTISAQSRKAALLLAALVGSASPALADQDVTVSPANNWIGYMNVFNLPADGGAYIFGSPWGTGDLAAHFNAAILTLSPNTNTYNPNDGFWVKPNGDGNKWMSANMYVENGGWEGQTVNFDGHTLLNSFVPDYSSQAFIKVLDPAQGYATIAVTLAPLTTGQDFSLTLAVPNIPGVVTQYGFVTEGANANPVTVDRLGHVEVTAVPAPAGAGLLVLGGVIAGRRRR